MKVKSKIFIILVVLLFLFACKFDQGISPGSGADGSAARSLAAGWNAARYGDIMDIGPYLRMVDNDPELRALVDEQVKAAAAAWNFDASEGGDAEGEDDDPFTFDGGTKDFLGYDSLYGYYFKSYTLRSVGANCEVWVADDLSYEDDRPDPVITQEQVDLMRDEFDSNIYPMDTGFFGIPDGHSGIDSQLAAWGYVPDDYYVSDDGIERIQIMVDNVRDESYYDPEYPFYIAGFYSSTFEAYYDRNVITIDSHQWEERLESVYFGTTAHEFQHLIHDDNDSAEDTWLNEGMSMFAEYLCGYGHPESHINFFLDHPENSLVEWDEHYDAVTGPETLADYGQAYLFMLYLDEHFGQDYIQSLAVSELHGIGSVESVLHDYGCNLSFAELFRRFSIALVVDSYMPGWGIYNFQSIDVELNYESALEYDKDGVPAWGADYKVIENAKKVKSIKMDGIEYLPIPWTTAEDPFDAGNTVLWGNEGEELANKIVLEVDLTGLSEATLTFDNFIQIEEQWDFGIVQVSTDHGETWTSLANENTRDDIVAEGYPAIIENLPGFTGYYDDWTNEVFDLSPYTGQVVDICFNYMTDWGYNDPGWFIDNIEIPEIGLSLDCSDMSAFISYDILVNRKVTYQVTFVNEKKNFRNPSQKFYRVLSLNPFSITEEQSVELRTFFQSGTNYMVVWFPAPEGVKGVADFEYELIMKPPKPPWPWWKPWWWNMKHR